MIIVDRNDSLKEIAGKGLLSAYDVKVVADMERLLGVLADKTFEEPVLILDSGEKTDTILNISFIKKIRNDVRVFVLSRRKEDTAFAVETFRAGTNDLFFYDSLQEVEGHLRSLQQGTTKKYLAKTIAFAGGGGGATFIAINVAHAMKRLYENFEFCLIDCDAFKNDVAMRMGADEGRQLYTVTDLVAEFYESGNFDMQSSLIANSISGITVIPASGSSFDVSQYGEDEYIKTLSYVSSRHDITIFNMGSCFDSIFRSVLSLSYRLFLVVAQELVSLKVALNLMQYLRRGGFGGGEIIVNRHTRDKESRVSPDTIRSILGKDVSFTFPEDYEAVSESEFSRRPIRAGDNAAIYQGIETLARHVLRSFLRG